MNKIIVNNGRISEYCKDFVSVNKNVLIFNKPGSYYLEYLDCSNVCLEFVINSDINVILSEISFNNKMIINNKYIISNGFLTVNKFYSNGSVDEKISINLNSEFSRIDYNFSNICLTNENYVIDINHNSKKTISNISNKSVSFNNSNLNFVINSYVSSLMEKSILNQETRIITLGNSNAKISPNMYIDIDDVKANHGSVIGTVKDEIVFYLMSRGISYNDALKLYIKSYLFSNIDANADVRSRICKIMDMYWG